ncbi:MAG TPA: hypothetical protein VIG40_04620 [Tissierellaceae bacterium]
MQKIENKNLKFQRNINLYKIKEDNYIPDNFYITTNYPTYLYYEDKCYFLKSIRKNCAVVLKNDEFEVKSIRNIKKDDEIVLSTTEDGTEGVFVDFNLLNDFKNMNLFTYESDINKEYDKLIDRLIYEKNNDGYIVWILGPSVIFDYDTRNALENLARNGYINCVFAGNAMATHDIEGGYLNTALGQNIYTQENVFNGHYNHLDLLNEVRRSGSIKNFIDEGNVKNGFMKTLVEENIPYVLAGSIRDDGPLPDVYADMNKALDEKERYLEKASLVIGLATMLHNSSTISIMPSYKYIKEEIKPIYFYGVDITTNVLFQLSNIRDHLAFVPFITNVQDFVVNINRRLEEKEVGFDERDS